MAKGLNLKALFTSDTTGLKKGSKEASESIKAFEQESSNAVESLANAMGIDIARLVEIKKAGEGAGRLLAKQFKGAGSEVVALAGAIGSATAVIGGLAVGAIAASWRELNAQAEYFYSTVKGAGEGANLEEYRNTLKAAIREMNDPEGAAAGVATIKRQFSVVGGYISSIVQQTANLITGVEQEGTFVENLIEGFVQVGVAAEKAKEAGNFAEQITDLQIALGNLQAGELADLKITYEEQRTAARDVNKTLEERYAMQKGAQDTLRKMIQTEVGKRWEIIRLLEQQYAITETTPEQQQELNNYIAQTKQLEASLNSQLRELLEYEKTLTNEKKKQTQEWEKQANLAAYQGTMSDLDQMDIGDFMPLPDFDEFKEEWEKFKAWLGAQEFPYDRVVNTDYLNAEFIKSANAARKVAEQINDSFKGIITNAATGIADLIGQSIAGTTRFSDGLFAMLGDILVQLGQVAIAAGIGMLEIKKAFESLNPWVAIAAGAALVALGSAISNSVSEIGTQIGGGGGGVAYAGANSSNGWNINAEPRTDKIELTGSFVVSGEDLVAVIGKNDRRKRYTR